MVVPLQVLVHQLHVLGDVLHVAIDIRNQIHVLLELLIVQVTQLQVELLEGNVLARILDLVLRVEHQLAVFLGLFAFVIRVIDQLIHVVDEQRFKALVGAEVPLLLLHVIDDVVLHLARMHRQHVTDLVVDDVTNDRGFELERVHEVLAQAVLRQRFDERIHLRHHHGVLALIVRGVVACDVDSVRKHVLHGTVCARCVLLYHACGGAVHCAVGYVHVPHGVRYEVCVVQNDRDHVVERGARVPHAGRAIQHLLYAHVHVALRVQKIVQVLVLRQPQLVEALEACLDLHHRLQDGVLVRNEADIYVRRGVRIRIELAAVVVVASEHDVVHALSREQGVLHLGIVRDVHGFVVVVRHEQQHVLCQIEEVRVQIGDEVLGEIRHDPYVLVVETLDALQ